MPADYPDYPSHWQVAKYFDDYAERFGLKERIAFNTEVVASSDRSSQVARRPLRGNGEWEVTVEGPDGRRERALPAP